MHYPSQLVPKNCCTAAKPVDEELVATAIAGVIKVVRAQGQSLEPNCSGARATACWISNSDAGSATS